MRCEAARVLHRFIYVRRFAVKTTQEPGAKEINGESGGVWQ